MYAGVKQRSKQERRQENMQINQQENKQESYSEQQPQRMKAYVLHGIGDFRYEEADVPSVDARSVLVHVKAVGICGSDIPRIYRTGAYHHPLIPGHEFAGEVVDVGVAVDASWRGKRVGVFPLIPCMTCPECRQKKYEMCQHYNYLGSRTDGGFAEYVHVPEWNLIELPEQVTMEQAAMLEPMAVAMHAIRRAQIKKEDRIAVCGLGTIGLFVVMFLWQQGFLHVYAAGTRQLQKDLARKLGIADDRYFGSRNDGKTDRKTGSFSEWLLQQTDGQGVDVYFDCVGKNEVIVQGIESLAAEGKLITVGNPASDITFDKKIYWKILRRQLQLIGTWNSSFTHEETDDWHHVLGCLERGEIHPEWMITHRLQGADFLHGFEIMRDKTEDYVKIMLTGETGKETGRREEIQS